MFLTRRPAVRQFVSEKNNNSPSIFEATSVVKHTSNLTTFAESTPEGMGSAGKHDQMALMANPYEDPELQKVLTRKYQIANFSWADTDTFNTSIGTIDPMASLLSVTNISEKLTQFRWLRADVQLEIRVNATPFHIGALMVSHLPRTPVSTDPDSFWVTKMTSMAQKSQNHGMVLSASSMNNITFTIAREAPVLLDPIDTPTGYIGCLGGVDISVLNPLILANGGSVAPVNVAVFASFSNPRVAGYGYFPLPTSGARAPRVSQHSLTVPGEAKDRASGSITGPEAKNLFDPTMITGPLETLQQAVSTIAPAIQFAASLGLAKPNNESTLVPAILDDYRDLNYTHGVVQATKLSAHPSASVGQLDFADLRKHKISEFISKPSYINTLFFDGGDNVDVPLLTIPVHPSLSYFIGNNYTATPLAYASNAFNYYRGGQKFLFEFLTSQFVTARFRVTHWPSPTLPASLEAYAGDAVSTIIDVRGDTRFEMTIPYISPFPYQLCRGYIHCNDSTGWANLPGSDQNSFITISLVNAIQQPEFNGTAGIYLNIYTAAAEDFVFGGLSKPTIRAPLNAVGGGRAPKISQHALVDRFAKTFAPLVPAHGAYEAGVVLPEQYTGVEETCLKYSPYLDETNTPDASGYVVGTLVQPTSIASNLDFAGFWQDCYRWNRGGLRYKLIPRKYDPGDAASPLILGAIAQPGGTPSYWSIADLRTRGALEAEIPWPLPTYMNSYWDSDVVPDVDVVTPAWNYKVFLLSGSSPVAGFYGFRAVSDDWVFGHQIAPSLYTNTPPPLSKGKEKETLHNNNAPELDQSLGLSAITREKLAKYLSTKSTQSASTSLR
jgi:hypothetical protein